MVLRGQTVRLRSPNLTSTSKEAFGGNEELICMISGEISVLQMCSRNGWQTGETWKQKFNVISYLVKFPLYTWIVYVLPNISPSFPFITLVSYLQSYVHGWFGLQCHGCRSVKANASAPLSGSLHYKKWDNEPNHLIQELSEWFPVRSVKVIIRVFVAPQADPRSLLESERTKKQGTISGRPTWVRSTLNT